MTATSTRPVPAAPRPTRASIRRDRVGKDWNAKTANQWTETTSNAGEQTYQMHRGLVVAIWTGSRGCVWANNETWDEVVTNPVWADELADVQREAQQTMPVAVMKDVSISAVHRNQTVVQPGRPVPVANVGITALAREVGQLVVDMARYEKPTPEVQAEFARRYGRYRDAMTRLREEFAAAEDSFELVQAMMVKFMGADDEQ